MKVIDKTSDQGQKDYHYGDVIKYWKNSYLGGKFDLYRISNYKDHPILALLHDDNNQEKNYFSSSHNRKDIEDVVNEAEDEYDHVQKVKATIIIEDLDNA